MAFYVYMLRCCDDSIYVGHTDDVEKRIADHRSRRYGGYTAKRLPVELIFSEEFATRDEAFRAERQIKGWRKSKKLALARREWHVVVELSAIRAPERRGTVGPPLMVRVPHHERVGRLRNPHIEADVVSSRSS